MKKRIFALLILVTTLALTACSQAPAATEPEYNVPTLPSFPTAKTPLQILSAAADKTKAAVSCTVEFGKLQEGSPENVHSRSVSADAPFDMDTLYSEIEDFADNENLLEDFCAQSLRATPSNNGTIRYEITHLTPEALSKLMYGDDGTRLSGFTGAVCTAAIVVDADGCLSRLEFVIQDQLCGTVTWFLSVSQIRLPE